MFPLADSFNFTPAHAYEQMPHDELDRRKEMMKGLIEQLRVAANLKDVEDYKLTYFNNVFDMTPAASSATHMIFLPALLFLSPNDFSAEFQGITNLEELNQRLNTDPQFLQNLSNRITQLLYRSNLTVNYEHRESLRLMVRYWTKNPELAMQGFRFVLLHELGHLHHKHSSDVPHQRLWMAVGGSAAALLTSLASFTFEMSNISSLLMAPMALAAALVAAKIIQKGRQISHSRAQEREADFVAISAISGEEGKKIREGGIYLFETLREHQIELRRNSRIPLKERFLFNLFFSPEGNNRFLYFTHPSEVERIQNIKNFEASQVPSKDPNVIP
jgi:hypothetical protein